MQGAWVSSLVSKPDPTATAKASHATTIDPTCIKEGQKDPACHNQDPMQPNKCVCVLSHVRSLQVHGRSPPGSSAHVILQVRILDGLPFPPPEDLPDPGIKSASLLLPALAGRFFSTVSSGITSSNTHTHTHTHTSRSVVTKFEYTLKFQRQHIQGKARMKLRQMSNVRTI